MKNRNICDKIFVSGETTKETMIIDGIKKDKIVVSGIPRFGALFKENKYIKTKKSRRINMLFLGSAFRWHGMVKLEKEEKEILLQLEGFAKVNRDIVDIFLKKHPRDNIAKNYQFLKNINIVENNKLNNYEIIQEFDLIICANLISTLIFESLCLNKMCIFLFPNKNDKIANEKKLRESVLIGKNFTDLKNILINIYNNKIDNRLYGNNKNYYISERSEFSDEIISKNIINEVNYLN